MQDVEYNEEKNTLSMSMSYLDELQWYSNPTIEKMSSSELVAEINRVAKHSIDDEYCLKLASSEMLQENSGDELSSSSSSDDSD